MQRAILYILLSVVFWEPISSDYISNASLSALVLGYLIHVFLAGVIGILFGSISYNYVLETRVRDQYNTWDFAFKDISDDAKVGVELQTGKTYRGQVAQAGTGEDNRDILISSPREGISSDNPSNRKLNKSEDDISKVADRPESESYKQQPEAGEENSSDFIAEIEQELEEDEEMIKAKEMAQRSADFLYVDEAHINALFFEDEEMAQPSNLAENADRVEVRVLELYDEAGLQRVVDGLRRLYCRYSNPDIPIAALLVIGAIALPSSISGIKMSFPDIQFFLYFILSVLVFNRLRSTENHIWRWLLVVALVMDLALSSLRYTQLVESGSLVITGIVVGYIIATAAWYIREQYSTELSWYLIMASTLILLLPTRMVLVGSVTPLVGRSVVVGVLLLFLLALIERIRRGRAERYSEWPKAIIDATAVVATVGLGSVLTVAGLIAPGRIIEAGAVCIPSLLLWIVIRSRFNYSG